MQRKMHVFVKSLQYAVFSCFCAHTLPKVQSRAVFCTETNAEKVASYPSVLRETVTKD